MKFYYSDINSNDFAWLQIFLYGTIVIIGIDISITIYEVLIGDITSAIGIIALFVVFLIVYLAYKGISQTKVLLPDFLLKKEDIPYKNNTNKTRIISNQTKIKHNPEELDILFKKLERLIRQQKCYLTPELTLKSVSEKLNISDKKLSYLLNQHMSISFYDYVNQFRVEEVKKKIVNPSFSKYTLLAIALECGFNSKTSFNRTFQRFEKITPSKFRNQVLKTKSNYDLKKL
ncbi:helix-turn-helix domain-containing protein [Aquimarina litoralis]|uniref:helix-turn-helix domain-containing protein n=1 Tax=Aquimarina litoralis TaxID=584605 RepID=UPI0031D3AAD2